MSTYTETHNVLLMRRNSDGLYFWMTDYGRTSDWGWTEDLSKAYRVEPYDERQLDSPESCEYYFENSMRAREIWCKDSMMVPCKIVVSTSVEPLYK